MTGRALLIVSGILMLLLGIARAAGGTALLLRGPRLDPDIQASPAIVVLLGTVLAILGIALVGAAVGVLCRSRQAWRWGIALLAAFVVDGAINGFLLYGRPGDRGTLANVLAAAIILLCLYLGRGALPPSEQR